MTQGQRYAYTLLEMMLVLAIIVIAAALSIPVMQTMLDDARQSAAGDMIRGKAAETRARAMESGRAWRLAYLPNTGVFQLAPDDAADWDNTGDQTPTEQDELIRDEMPKDIVLAMNAGDIQAAQSAGAPGSGWQTIAVYLYDGSARDSDSITYFGKMGMPPLGVQIRALTGSATVLSAKEVMDVQA
jgi:prepilin-type N-terminal cleavage/methylation domain-containing protein